jgi:hypothetical protein
VVADEDDRLDLGSDEIEQQRPTVRAHRAIVPSEPSYVVR